MSHDKEIILLDIQQATKETPIFADASCQVSIKLEEESPKSRKSKSILKQDFLYLES